MSSIPGGLGNRQPSLDQLTQVSRQGGFLEGRKYIGVGEEGLKRTGDSGERGLFSKQIPEEKKSEHRQAISLFLEQIHLAYGQAGSDIANSLVEKHLLEGKPLSTREARGIIESSEKAMQTAQASNLQRLQSLKDSQGERPLIEKMVHGPSLDEAFKEVEKSLGESGRKLTSKELQVLVCTEYNKALLESTTLGLRDEFPGVSRLQKDNAMLKLAGDIAGKLPKGDVLDPREARALIDDKKIGWYVSGSNWDIGVDQFDKKHLKQMMQDKGLTIPHDDRKALGKLAWARLESHPEYKTRGFSQDEVKQVLSQLLDEYNASPREVFGGLLPGLDKVLRDPPQGRSLFDQVRVQLTEESGPVGETLLSQRQGLLDGEKLEPQRFQRDVEQQVEHLRQYDGNRDKLHQALFKLQGLVEDGKLGSSGAIAQTRDALALLGEIEKSESEGPPEMPRWSQGRTFQMLKCELEFQRLVALKEPGSDRVLQEPLPPWQPPQPRSQTLIDPDPKQNRPLDTEFGTKHPGLAGAIDKLQEGRTPFEQLRSQLSRETPPPGLNQDQLSKLEQGRDLSRSFGGRQGLENDIASYENAMLEYGEELKQMQHVLDRLENIGDDKWLRSREGLEQVGGLWAIVKGIEDKEKGHIQFETLDRPRWTDSPTFRAIRREVEFQRLRSLDSSNPEVALESGKPREEVKKEEQRSEIGGRTKLEREIEKRRLLVEGHTIDGEQRMIVEVKEREDDLGNLDDDAFDLAVRSNRRAGVLPAFGTVAKFDFYDPETLKDQVGKMDREQRRTTRNDEIFNKALRGAMQEEGVKLDDEKAQRIFGGLARLNETPWLGRPESRGERIDYYNQLVDMRNLAAELRDELSRATPRSAPKAGITRALLGDMKDLVARLDTELSEMNHVTGDFELSDEGRDRVEMRIQKDSMAPEEDFVEGTLMHKQVEQDLHRSDWDIGGEVIDHTIEESWESRAGRYDKALRDVVKQARPEAPPEEQDRIMKQLSSVVNQRLVGTFQSGLFEFPSREEPLVNLMGARGTGNTSYTIEVDGRDILIKVDWSAKPGSSQEKGSDSHLMLDGSGSLHDQYEFLFEPGEDGSPPGISVLESRRRFDARTEEI